MDPMTEIAKALESKDAKQVQELLPLVDVDVFYKDKPLLCLAKNPQTVSLLLKAKANPNAVDLDHSSVLSFVARNKTLSMPTKLDCMRVLLEAKANPDPDRLTGSFQHNRVPTTTLTETEDLPCSVLELLLEHGASVSHPRRALLHNHIHCPDKVKLLLKNKADPLEHKEFQHTICNAIHAWWARIKKLQEPPSYFSEQEQKNALRVRSILCAHSPLCAQTVLNVENYSRLHKRQILAHQAFVDYDSIARRFVDGTYRSTDTRHLIACGAQDLVQPALLGIRMFNDVSYNPEHQFWNHSTLRQLLGTSDSLVTHEHLERVELLMTRYPPPHPHCVTKSVVLGMLVKVWIGELFGSSRATRALLGCLKALQPVMDAQPDPWCLSIFNFLLWFWRLKSKERQTNLMTVLRVLRASHFVPGVWFAFKSYKDQCQEHDWMLEFCKLFPPTNTQGNVPHELLHVWQQHKTRLLVGHALNQHARSSANQGALADPNVVRCILDLCGAKRMLVSK